jgi:GxxExxY protein
MEKKGEIIYKELSYEIVGILFETCNELGYGYKEKYYEKAIIECLKEKKINFINQAPFALKFKGKVIGRNYIDFIIDNKIVLEIKKGNYFSRRNMEQIKEYLKVTNFKLAILANFTPTGVRFTRILNA